MSMVRVTSLYFKPYFHLGSFMWSELQLYNTQKLLFLTSPLLANRPLFGLPIIHSLAPPSKSLKVSLIEWLSLPPISPYSYMMLGLQVKGELRKGCGLVSHDSCSTHSSSVDAPEEVDLESGLTALQAAVDLMNNNKYHEAVRLLKPKSVPPSCPHSPFPQPLSFLPHLFNPPPYASLPPPTSSFLPLPLSLLL